MSCRAKRPQLELVRLHRAVDGSIRLDDRWDELGSRSRRGAATGRGAYVCRRARCLQEVPPARLARVLRTRSEPSLQLLRELRDVLA
ncbi:MAG: YlxR family protein [Actinobacteria bacterium]|nr:YlxR family protein [Actinomycetota bacterium]